MDEKHLVPYGKYVMVWLALFVLTGCTITITGAQLGQLSVFAAILIASIKGILILFYFMHLKYEPPVFKITLVLAIFVVAVIMVLTFADVSFR